MTKSRYIITSIVLLFLGLASCKSEKEDGAGNFDELKRKVVIGNWQFALNVENQNKGKVGKGKDLGAYYLKASVYISNIKTKKSLLYSSSKDAEDYEAKYKYLSFESQRDLYIKWKEQIIYPIGYVFEPSNGLSTSERLVYKFQLSKDDYEKLMQDSKNVEYWYAEKIVGLGKICFKQQQ